MVSLPSGAGAGQVSNEFVYNLDITATIYDLVGLRSADGLDGRSLRPLVDGGGSWQRRDYVTCRYDHSVCYIDDRTHALGDVWGRPQEVFDLEADPACMKDILAGDGADGPRWRTAWQRLLADAGGKFPEYRINAKTDAVGQKI